ncbi:MAG: phosphatase PAP2 family protein [Burkholderiaceae bacterium]
MPTIESPRRPIEAAASGAFLVRMAPRLRACFWLKTLGFTAYMWLFFVGYFHLLRHPARPVTVMPLAAVDDWIGFQPWALWPYLSLWLYVALPPSLIDTSRELVRYGVWIAALLAAGLLCFFWWPTAVPQLALATDHPGFALLRGVDAAGNACPSLHVAAALFSALWLHRLLGEAGAPAWLRVANAAWVGAIVWSTMAVKQHVWWDVLAGIALALAFAPASLPRQGGAGDGAIIAGRGNTAEGTR